MYLVFTRNYTLGGVDVPCIYTKLYLGWSWCTLYLHETIPWVELMYLVFTRNYTLGGVDVPCIYTKLYLGWSWCTLYLHETIPWVELMYLVFTRMLRESYRRPLRFLLYLCYVIRALIKSLVYWFQTFQDFGPKCHFPQWCFFPLPNAISPMIWPIMPFASDFPGLEKGISVFPTPL